METKQGKKDTFTDIGVLVASGPKERDSDVQNALGTILIVEDEDTLRRALARFCVSWGYSVHKAKNGFEGLGRYVTGEYDLVITDQHMPQMDGFELVCHMTEFANRRELATPKVILTTSVWYDPTRAEDRLWREAGFVDYVQKPYSFDRIKELVQKHAPAKSLLDDINQ